MAKHTIIQLTDDIDNSEATETVEFALDGQAYEIDLNDEHAAQLREVIAKYVEAARKAGRSNVTSIAKPRARRVETDVDTKTVKEWAKANGRDVPARGRLPQALIAEFKAAGN